MTPHRNLTIRRLRSTRYRRQVAVAALVGVLGAAGACGNDSTRGEAGPKSAGDSSSSTSPAPSSPASSSPASSGAGESGSDESDADPGREASGAPGSAPRFPTPGSVGLPEDWKPTRTVTGDYPVDDEGAVVENIRVVNGTIIVRAENVTIRHVELVESAIRNVWDGCYNGLVVEDAVFKGEGLPEGSTALIWPGGYTVRRVLVDDVAEGLRVSGKEDGCGTVTIENSYVRAHYPKEECQEWHGDAFQGYEGPPAVLRDTVLELVTDVPNDCGGTAPFFYPDQGNTKVTVDGLLVKGGTFAFRLGTPGRIKDLFIVDGSWQYGPLDVNCQLVTEWEAYLAEVDDDGQPASVAKLPCDNEIR